MFNATFNDISFVLIVAVVLTEETVVFAENHKLYHIMLYQVHLTINRIRTDNFCDDIHSLHM